MTEPQITEVMEHYQQYLPTLSALTLQAKLRNASPNCMDNLMRVRMKSRTAAILLAVFLGSIGVARFYLHDIFIAVLRIMLTAFGLLAAYIEVKHYPFIPLDNSWWNNSWFGLNIISIIVSFIWHIVDIFLVAARTKHVNLNRLIRFLSMDKYKNYDS